MKCWEMIFGENCWDRDIINIVQKEQVLDIPKLRMKNAYDLIAIMRIFLKIAVKHKLGFDRWIFLVEPVTKDPRSYRMEVESYRKIKLLAGPRKLVKASTQVQANLQDIPLTLRSKIKQDVVNSIHAYDQIDSQEIYSNSSKAIFQIKPPSLVKRERILRRRKQEVGPS